MVAGAASNLVLPQGNQATLAQAAAPPAGQIKPAEAPMPDPFARFKSVATSSVATQPVLAHTTDEPWRAELKKLPDWCADSLSMQAAQIGGYWQVRYEDRHLHLSRPEYETRLVLRARHGRLVQWNEDGGVVCHAEVLTLANRDQDRWIEGKFYFSKSSLYRLTRNVHNASDEELEGEEEMSKNPDLAPRVKFVADVPGR